MSGNSLDLQQDPSGNRGNNSGGRGAPVVSAVLRKLALAVIAGTGAHKFSKRKTVL